MNREMNEIDDHARDRLIAEDAMDIKTIFVKTNLILSIFIALLFVALSCSIRLLPVLSINLFRYMHLNLYIFD